MKWKSNPPVTYKGEIYGMKDIEFEKFFQLPLMIKEKMEIAVSGEGIPKDRLKKAGWIVRDGDDISTSVDNYRNYIANSAAEFSVAKNGHVKTNSGIFLERSGYYLQSGKPVILQDTGWSDHLPTGRGLFAINNMNDAVEALQKIKLDYQDHCKWAREIACEYFDAEKVLKKMLNQIGL